MENLKYQKWYVSKIRNTKGEYSFRLIFNNEKESGIWIPMPGKELPNVLDPAYEEFKLLCVSKIIEGIRSIAKLGFHKIDPKIIFNDENFILMEIYTSPNSKCEYINRLYKTQEHEIDFFLDLLYAL